MPHADIPRGQKGQRYHTSDAEGDKGGYRREAKRSRQDTAPREPLMKTVVFVAPKAQRRRGKLHITTRTCWTASRCLYSPSQYGKRATGPVLPRFRGETVAQLAVRPDACKEAARLRPPVSYSRREHQLAARRSSTMDAHRDSGRGRGGQEGRRREGREEKACRRSPSLGVFGLARPTGRRGQGTLASPGG